MVEQIGPKPDPVQKELDLIDQRLASPRKLNEDALTNSLDRIARRGTSRWSSPGEMMAELAAISRKIADAAIAKDQLYAATRFTEKSEKYLDAAVQALARSKDDSLESERSNPEETTGVAAG